MDIRNLAVRLCRVARPGVQGIRVTNPVYLFRQKLGTTGPIFVRWEWGGKATDTF